MLLQVTRVFEASSLQAEVGAIAQKMASLPPQSMKLSRALIRGDTVAELEAVPTDELKLSVCAGVMMSGMPL